MPASRIPSYRYHSASGQAVVTLDYRDHYLGSFGSPESRARYEQLVAEWLANGRRMSSPAKAGLITVTELLAAYLAFAESYYNRNGETTSEYVAVRDALKPVRGLYGLTVVRDFGPLSLKAVREQMIAAGLARKHINQRINRVRRCFKWGVENELVPPSVSRDCGPWLRSRKGGPKPVKPSRSDRCRLLTWRPSSPTSRAKSPP
jgi:hypothetical protein